MSTKRRNKNFSYIIKDRNNIALDIMLCKKNIVLKGHIIGFYKNDEDCIKK